MVKRWLSALSSRWKQSASYRDLTGEPVASGYRDSSPAKGLFDRYRQAGDLGALSNAVASYRRALAKSPADDPHRPLHLSNLGATLGALFEQTGKLDALIEAVNLCRDAVAATPIGHPNQAMYLNNLGNALRVMFEHSGKLNTLTEAIQIGRDAVAATLNGDPDKAMYLSSLSIALGRLFEQTGDLDTITEAVFLEREAVAALPTGHPSRAGRLGNLGGVLRMLFERTGELDALTEAIQVSREAVAAILTGHHPMRAVNLSNLSAALQRLFERTGKLDALTEAVRVGRDAVAATPTGHPNQAMYLSNLGVALQTLFEQTSELDTLTEAVTLKREALAATPIGRPNRAIILTNLGDALLALFERTRDFSALTEAIQVGRDAVAATPIGHSDRTMCLNLLGGALRVLSERTGGDLRLLTNAVDHGRDAVAACPTDHPHRATTLINLCASLVRLFEYTEKLDTLTAAIRVGREAVAATPAGHPNRATIQYNLGVALQTLFERTGKRSALNEARQVFVDAVTAPAASTATRIMASRGAANAAILAEEPQAALTALESTVELVPQLIPRALSRSDRAYGLYDLAGFASEVAAAAVAAGRPERAVELLEQIRGLLLGEAIDARSDLTELRRVAPALAAEFDNFREWSAAVDNAELSPVDRLTRLTTAVTYINPAVEQEAYRQRANQLAEQRRQLADQWTALIGRIRSMAGFEQFLRPPPITRLRQQADGGPIVIVYVSRQRADALIVTNDAAHPVKAVPLPRLSWDAAFKQTGRLLAAVDEQAQDEVHAVLGWLWDTITCPVLENLATSCDPGSRPRIWWCPVGLLAYMPLHAAGYHTHTEATPVPRTVLDQVISSYTTTLRALEYARASRETPPLPTGSSVIIAMPRTPKASNLPGAGHETKTLAKLLGSPLTLTGAKATHQAVAAALPRHRIAHFACHGLSDWANPAASRLLLHDHQRAPLTVAALMRIPLANVELAYLSACRTTDTNPALADEAIHLTAAVQLAGYRHVIGTLWPIHDEAAVYIATDVYTHLTNDGTQPARAENSAPALAEATRSLRDKFPALPTRWAAHIHFGP